MKYLLILMSVIFAFVLAVMSPILLIPLMVIAIILVIVLGSDDDKHKWGF